jgi:hypothetical protein
MKPLLNSPLGQVLIDDVLHSQKEIEGANVPQAIRTLIERVKEDLNSLAFLN